MAVVQYHPKEFAPKKPAKSNVVELFPAKRNIATEYLAANGKTKTWVNLSSNPRNAIKNAQEYVFEDRYKAAIAVIYNTDTGLLHAIIKRNSFGDVIIMQRHNNFEPTFIMLEQKE
jgi:hypothetical protein